VDGLEQVRELLLRDAQAALGRPPRTVLPLGEDPDVEAKLRTPLVCPSEDAGARSDLDLGNDLFVAVIVPIFPGRRLRDRDVLTP
jgi:hypothetical protein